MRYRETRVAIQETRPPLLPRTFEAKAIEIAVLEDADLYSNVRAASVFTFDNSIYKILCSSVFLFQIFRQFDYST